MGRASHSERAVARCEQDCHDRPMGKKSKGTKAKSAKALQAELDEVREEVLDDVASSPQKVADRLQFEPGDHLSDIDPRSTPGIDGGKEEGQAALAAGVDRLSDLQERLYAEGKGGGRRSLLLVIQGMDTSGKGGVMRHVVGAVDPQ